MAHLLKLSNNIGARSSFRNPKWPNGDGFAESAIQSIFKVAQQLQRREIQGVRHNDRENINGELAITKHASCFTTLQKNMCDRIASVVYQCCMYANISRVCMSRILEYNGILLSGKVLLIYIC